MKTTADLLKAIGPSDLTGYFEFLDEIRQNGRTNMFAGARYLTDHFTGMSMLEARVVLAAWMDTFSHSLPAEDRADQALEAAR
jgi:hypothetical protein